jgi:undecaprenyl-diphosphatase
MASLAHLVRCWREKDEGSPAAGGLASLAVLLSATALLIGYAVSAGFAQKLDQDLLLALRTPGDPITPIGPGWLAETARDATALGGVTVLTILTILAVSHFSLRREWSAAVWIAGVAISGTMISNVLKAVFDRPRPELTAMMAFGPGSFPSGHSTASAAIYLTLGMMLAQRAERRSLKVFYLLTAALLTGIVGLSRVYLGVHYPTDVAAGWSIGAAWAIVCALIASLFDRRDRRT